MKTKDFDNLAKQLKGYRYCQKEGIFISTTWLKGDICLNCDHFVLNKAGFCDPL